jgi:hypothetical protein
MKNIITIFLLAVICIEGRSQIDPELLKKTISDTSNASLNMDAVYNRPFTQLGKLPAAIGGYVEANYQYLSENGISEGHRVSNETIVHFSFFFHFKADKIFIGDRVRRWC